MADLKAEFEAFHEANPHVYELYVKYTAEMKASGRSRFSISMITERIRWYTAIETDDPEFKINNNHRAFYARKLMEDPRFAGMFSIREQKQG